MNLHIWVGVKSKTILSFVRCNLKKNGHFQHIKLIVPVLTFTFTICLCFSDLPLTSGDIDLNYSLGLNLTSAEIGPPYNLDRNFVHILGPSLLNLEEGEELALICEAQKISQIQWRKKVRRNVHQMPNVKKVDRIP